MRTALCLCGIVGGKGGRDGGGGNVPFEECYNTYKDRIIDINGADVFIHSWSCDVKDEVVGLYKPVKYEFNQQKTFKKERKLFTSLAAKKQESAYRSLSRWYSTKKVIELKKAYEVENKFKYDCVMLARFDLLFFVDLNFSNYDLKYLHASNWNTPMGLPGRPHIKADKVNRSLDRDGFLDLWFFSNSDTMDEFAEVYDGIVRKEYSVSQHSAPWDRLVKNGYSKNDFKYIFYRHFDYEIYRWHMGFYQQQRNKF
jgi:hypothetical protein